jgi:L-fuconolactonase
MGRVIDAHQHFWDLSRFDHPWVRSEGLGPLRRDFLPSDLEPLLGPAGVDGTVFVQTRHDVGEARWALGLSDRHEFLVGVVGWVDLASEACEDHLAALESHARFVGVRHITHDEPDDDWIVREDVLRGLRALERHRVPFDLLLRPRHLRHVPTLARRLPDLPMVIDHLAKPPIRTGRLEGWREDLQAAARFPNVFCKLSGMVTEADPEAWSPRDFVPYVRTALEAFGPERLMFGSDWPVSTLCASYGHVVSALRHALGPISADERAWIFGGTAERFYGLKPAELTPSGRRSRPE